jgi:uncharacterized protein
MKYSRYNIFSRIRNSENYFIVNLLTGNADILNPAEAKNIEALKNNSLAETDEFVSELAEKGYLTEEEEENRLFRSRYFDFIDSRGKDEIQIFFVTNYSCNFACSYCYQDQYNNPRLELSNDIIDAFFNYVTREFADRKKYITVFGGEPLLNSPKQKELISRVIKKSQESGLEICFVTNGYFLEEYIEILKTAKIREVQVTLDGTEMVHNRRRFLKGGDGTFSKIVRGIDASLQNGININLRMVVDKANIQNLPDLAQFAIDKGWTKNPLFKTQIGRNYELHHCQSAPDKLFDRISLYEYIYELVKEHPYITEFYKPAYSVSKFLSENGELPDPLFDSCPACKTEWAFDYTGNIYSCTATVGKSEESLGTFYPTVNLKDDIVREWEERDVTAIPECRDCAVQLACGGGCGSVAKNRMGSICAPDCRPVKELLELGFAAYIEKSEIN